ncbi:MAG TPA: general secretion pathway protein GspE, partial [Planctomycetaceae bacterium]|nr:general secretion pathway protein GspE [Planctomycetaceae bacterium]
MSIALRRSEVAERDSTRHLTIPELRRARQIIATEGQLASFVPEGGFSNELEALNAIGATLGLTVVDLSKETPEESLLNDFPVRLIHRYNIFPIRRTEDSITLAVSNPFDVQAADAVAEATGVFVEIVLALPHEVGAMIKSHLGVGAQTLDGLIAQTEESSDIEVIGDLEFDESEASTMAQEASVVRLVNDILVEAVAARASDIHMEVQATGLKIRNRIDGVLQTQPVPPELNRFQAAIISRLKIMAHLNIAEKRVPQDGRIKIRVSGREVDIRVSIIPMLHGE